MTINRRALAALVLVVASCSSTPASVSPSTTVPSTTVPFTAVPSTTVPSTAVPSTAVPSSAAPATNPAPTTSDEPAAASTPVEVATINVLHGFPGASDCLETTDRCLAPVRIDILWSHLENDVGCPEIIALQEISPRWFELVPQKLPELCDGDHVLLTEDVGGVDQEMILTTLTVIDHARTDLAGGPIWSAHWAQLDAGDGVVVDVFATHFASSAFNPPCDDAAELTTCGATCPPESDLGGCHPFETLAFLADRAAPGSLQLVIGDLNKEVHEARLTTLLDAGFSDTHLVAGNGECRPEGGANCTTGIGGETDLAGLDLAEQHPQRRIDFILARPPDGCDLVVDADDQDGDGTRTGLWANVALAEPVSGLYWASDHTGIQADVGVDCR